MSCRNSSFLNSSWWFLCRRSHQGILLRSYSSSLARWVQGGQEASKGSCTLLVHSLLFTVVPASFYQHRDRVLPRFSLMGDTPASASQVLGATKPAWLLLTLFLGLLCLSHKGICPVSQLLQHWLSVGLCLTPALGSGNCDPK